MQKFFDSMEKMMDEIIDSVKNKLNKLVIDKETFEVSGNNIVVKNGQVFVNGKLIKENLSGQVTIKFEGDLANLDCTSSVINGNVQGNVDGTSVTVNGSVSGDVDGTDINITGDVGGNVDGTEVRCGNVMGSIDAVTVKRKA